MFDYIHILWDAVFLTKHPCFGEKAMGLSLASVKCYVSARGRTLSPTKMLCLCHGGDAVYLTLYLQSYVAWSHYKAEMIGN